MRTLLLLLLSALPLYAQQPPAVVTPSDPAALLAIARTLHGLEDPQLKPWHMKATFQTFDSKGKPQDNGTFEEFWAAPDKYKRIYTSTNFTRTESRTKDGFYHSGSKDPVPFPVSIIAGQLVSPMPTDSATQTAELEMRKVPFGKLQLQCVILSQKIHSVAPIPFGLFPAYCFDLQKPILRFSIFDGGLDVTENEIGVFQGRYVPLKVSISDLQSPLINIHIDTLASLPAESDSDFTPSQDAILVDNKAVPVSPGVMSGHLLTPIRPVYPQSAKEKHITGTVQLKATIGRDGHIHGLRIAKADDASLAVSALFAAQRATYKPYYLNGEPVEVETTINVNYTLGP